MRVKERPKQNRLQWYRGVRCHLCTGVIEREDVSRDHKIPRSAGGTIVIPAHTRCNNLRGNLPWDRTRAVVRKLGRERTPEQVQSALKAALHDWRNSSNL